MGKRGEGQSWNLPAAASLLLAFLSVLSLCSMLPYAEAAEIRRGNYVLSKDALDVEVLKDNFAGENFTIRNSGSTPLTVRLMTKGNVSALLPAKEVSVLAGEEKLVEVKLFGSSLEGTNAAGALVLSGDIQEELGLRVATIKAREEAYAFLEIEVMTDKEITAGNELQYRVQVNNLRTDLNFSALFRYSIYKMGSNKTIWEDGENLTVRDSFAMQKSFKIPKSTSPGAYVLLIQTDYLGFTSEKPTPIMVKRPFYLYPVFGKVPLWMIMAGLAAVGLGLFVFKLIKKAMEAKKRFHVQIEMGTLPKPGARSIYLGKLAEMPTKAWYHIDQLNVHTIVAGSTGGGKTISAQVIIEECLMKNIAVIVFDPTAQWSGMLRKCADKGMMVHYPEFGLKQTDARAYNGNVRAIHNAREKIELAKFMKPGEIQIFTLSTLDPKDIDIFVGNTVREIFHSNLEESKELKCLIVYDEVHRLLPKFGGSGMGFLQIERCVREVRKWGIGIMLISQVLADFVGQIKAGINTEVQMKTRDEGDLERIKMKYGESYIQELIKSPVGTGMIQNSAFNKGKPYYVTFRPILHSVVRLSDEELAKYNKYNEIIDDLEFQLEQLDGLKQDVFDLKLELKLSKDKVKSGAFNMVDIYVEGLKPRIQKFWDKLGIQPKQRVVELVDEKLIEEEAALARAARGEKAAVEEKKAHEGPYKFNEDVPPGKIMNLKNSMIVINMTGLINELIPMDEETFKFHCNDAKHDFADWLRDACQNPGFAEEIRKLKTKDEMIAALKAAKEKEKAGGG